MTRLQTSSFSEKSFSDRVIDGLFAGLLAGVLMVLAMLTGAVIARIDPVAVLGSFSVSQESAPVNGLLVHLGVSGVYGAIFSILLSLIPAPWRRFLPGWLTGLVYGAVLLTLAIGLLLPGLRSPMANIPTGILIAGHIVYGLILGWRISPR